MQGDRSKPQGYNSRHNHSPSREPATVRTRQGSSVRVAHRRSPSELTPLVQEKLALQQQIEMLQAQQQQMLAQQQYGMMPVYPSMPPPGMIPAYPYYPQPQMPAASAAAGSGPASQTSSPGGHQRQRSGHQRRHSLHVSEARRAAHVEQQRRDGPSSSSATPSPGASPMTPDLPSSPRGLGSPGPAHFDETLAPPQSPLRNSHHIRAASTGSNASPTRNQFTFPPQNVNGSSGPGVSGGAGSNNQSRHGRTGSMHRRANSRNMDGNWRQQSGQGPSGAPSVPAMDFLAPPAFVPGHRSRGSFNSVSSIAAFTEGHNGPGGSLSGRKSLFAPYLSQSSIPQLLADGLLVSGTLRVNRKNRSDAFVTTDVLDADIFICGSKDRNRALEGDIVAVELLDVNDVWDSKKEKEEKKRRRDASDDTLLVETASGELRRKGSLKQRPTHKRNDDVEVEGQTLLLKEEEQVSDEVRPLYAGHVVAILERPTGQLFSGTLGLLRPSSQATKERQQQERAEKGEPPLAEPATRDRPKIVWFKPTDKCVPLMAIPTEQAPTDFVENHQAYADKIFVAAIKRWPITSLHPFGTLIEELGPSDGNNAVVTSVLRDNNFGSHKFSENAASATDIAAEEMAKTAAESKNRPIYRNAVAISPVPALSEVAFSLSKADDKIKLAIHVVDLASFVREGSPLDRELRHKSAGVYMQQLTSPLIPDKWAAKLEFAADRETPALTVEFDFDSSWEILDTKIFESVVTPSKVIDFDELASQESFAELEKITSASRQARCSAGLSLDNMLKVQVPCGPGLFNAPNPASQLYDELCYRVNATVAQKLLSSYGPQALLYRQGEPLLGKLEALAAALTNAGPKFNTLSPAAINASISAIEDRDVRHAVEIAMLKCLAPQRYAISGRCDPLSYSHYWLSLPAYTHFTNPLRRYADLVVQRQVHSVLSGARPNPDDEPRLAALASELSFRLDCAKNVQDQSIHLELSRKIADKAQETGYILHTGIVVQVYESAFDVVIPELSLEKRVHGDQLPLVKAEFHKPTHRLELFWDPDRDAATFAPVENSSTPKSKSTVSIAAESNYDLDAAIANLNVRSEGDSYVQEIRMLQRVPVLLRADLAMHTLPSITVRTVNPFYKEK